MKTQILAALAPLVDLLNGLPDDPLPPVAIPTGLAVVRTYGWPEQEGAPLSIELTWDGPFPDGCQPLLEYKGAEGNLAGPGDWTGIQVNAVAGIHGEWATHTMQNPEGQAIVFRLRANRTADGAYSDAVLLPYPVI